MGERMINHPHSCIEFLLIFPAISNEDHKQN